jgi:hypothetical protein
VLVDARDQPCRGAPLTSDRLPLIGIDQCDVVELVEMLEFVESWLAQAEPAVAADFERFVGAEGYPLVELRTDLIAWAVRLALTPAEPQS